MQRTSEVYRTLYHYTDWDGLLGILKRTKTLWATHCRFLSDCSEILLFRDRLVSLLVPYVREECEKHIRDRPDVEKRIQQEGGLDEIVEHETGVLVDGLRKATGEEIYIVSFCGEHSDSYINRNGLLSQWRGYGLGGGFAIVFNTQRLEEILEIGERGFAYMAMHLSDVVYSDDENKLRRELSEDLFEIADGVKLVLNRILSGQTPSETDWADVSRSYQPFVRCISRYKHRGFREENEVRIVAVPTVHDQESLTRDGESNPELAMKERRFRQKNGRCIPYIELLGTTDIDLAIEKVIVGPHKNKEAHAAALRLMLRGTHIGVECSAIPYVG
jgi:hypothetical protein